MANIETINATQANIEAPVEIQLSLSSPIYRGPAGAQGPQGLPGNPGVWVGTEEPGIEYEVWIDPEGDGIEAPVGSINGKTGTVVLTAADVGALPANTVIPPGFDILSNYDVEAIWHNI